MSTKQSSGVSSKIVSVLCLALMAAWLLPFGARAQTTNDWNKAGAGLYWQTAANWTPGTVPNGVGSVARITNNLAAGRIISTTNDVTLGELWIGSSAAFNWTVLNTNSSLFTFDNGGNGAWIRKHTGNNDTLNTPIVLADNLTVTNSAVGKAVIINSKKTSAGFPVACHGAEGAP